MTTHDFYKWNCEGCGAAMKRGRYDCRYCGRPYTPPMTALAPDEQPCMGPETVGYYAPNASTCDYVSIVPGQWTSSDGHPGL